MLTAFDRGWPLVGLAIALATSGLRLNSTDILALRYTCCVAAESRGWEILHDISIFAWPSFCHSLIRQKPETVLHSLGAGFYVGNNNAHPLKVVGALWRTKQFAIRT